MFGSIAKTVASAATAEAISPTTLRVAWATIQAKATNTGTVRIIGPTAAALGGYTISGAGGSFVLWAGVTLNLAIDLNHVFAKVSVDGEGVDVSFVK